MPRACSDRASTCARFSIGWGTNRWRRQCGIWYQRAMFMTGWIRLSCPVSLRTQIRHGSPFNWESLPAEDRFASTIDSRKAGSFRWAAPTRKMFLDLSALRASGGVADPRRPCEQESSFFRPVRKSQWRKPLLGLERTWDSLAGLGPGGAACTGAARMSSRRMWAKHLQVWRESPVGQSTRKECAWAVGWASNRLANLSCRQVRPQGNLRWSG